MSEQKPLLQVKNLFKSFKMGATEIPILKGVDLDVNAGDAICIMGSSGAGKSTLLQILGTLDRPTRGEVLFQGVPLHAKNDKELSEFRNTKLGFVFQFHHLLSEFTALENVMIPCQISGKSDRESESLSQKVLDLLGLKQRGMHYPSELSGGEQQRVAIARALVLGPSLVLADEPTGNLDSENAQNIQRVLFDLQEQLNLSLVVVSHDIEFSKKFPRVLVLKDGKWSNA